MVACNHIYSNQDVEVIDLNKCFDSEQLDIVRTQYAYDGRIIKLETKEECLLRLGGKLLLSDNRIFIKQNTVYIFDFEGNFINKLKMGTGPGEIARVKAIDFDTETNELVLYQEPYIKFYTPDGTFLREQESPYYFTDIKAVKGGYILSSDAGYMQCADNPEATLLYVDKKMNLISAHLNKTEKAVYYEIQCMYYDINKGKTIVPNRNDTIYILDKEQFIPKFVVDYSIDKFDYTIKDINLWFKEENRHYSWWKYFETSSHQFFGLQKSGMGLNIFRDKSNGKLLAGNYYAINALFNVTPDATYNDYFVSVKHYIDRDGELEKLNIFTPEDLAKINNQKEDDNPLLIFFKLKPFEDEE